jgi:CheY-like chemotaxis protein
MKFRSGEGSTRVVLDPRFPASGSTELLAEPPPRVLLAEDNRDLQHVFAGQLTLLGLEVIGVTNGRDAVDLILAAHRGGHPFDLVLMDLEMPILDGYEATRRIRDGGFPGPILALSAHSTDDYRLASLTMGCTDCLCKPLDWNQLVALIRKYLPGHVLPDRVSLNAD